LSTEHQLNSLKTQLKDIKSTLKGKNLLIAQFKQILKEKDDLIESLQEQIQNDELNQAVLNKSRAKKRKSKSKDDDDDADYEEEKEASRNDKKRGEKKITINSKKGQESEQQSKEEKAKEMDESMMKENMRKTIREALQARLIHLSDEEKSKFPKENTPEFLATRIQEELTTYYGGANEKKCKSKYRSIIFNIKYVTRMNRNIIIQHEITILFIIIYLYIC
jgi:hypothetical protein